MARISKVFGGALVGLSLMAVCQTVREIALWDSGQRRYTERLVAERDLVFGKHRVSVTDSLPTDSLHSQDAVPGSLRLTVDGVEIGKPTHAAIRRSLSDNGRYHLWFSAWVFRERERGDSSLWLARRIQPDADTGFRFEVTVLGADGTVRTRWLRAWQLGWEYRMFRSTQYLREGTWTTMPLTLSGLLGFFPLALLVFPIGTFVAGTILWRRGRSAGSVAPAV